MRRVLANDDDAAAMRRLMERERPSWGFWDMKRPPGGLIDCEFAAQTLQVIHAGEGAALHTPTVDALEAQAQADALSGEDAAALIEAWPR